MATKPQITGTLVSLRCQSHLCNGHTMQHVWPVSLQNSQEFPAAAQTPSIVFFLLFSSITRMSKLLLLVDQPRLSMFSHPTPLQNLKP